MTSQPFTLLVDIPLKPGRADEFMALLNDVFEAMKVEETFVSETALRSAEHPVRHASSRFTLDVYSQARKGAKRQAQQRVVQMILPEIFDDAVPEISLESARNDVE